MKNKPRKWVLFIFNAILIATMSFFAYGIISKIDETAKYQTKKSQQEAKIEQLKIDEASLKEEKAKLENPEYILRYARGKYLLSGEGETIIKLPSKNR